MNLGAARKWLPVLIAGLMIVPLGCRTQPAPPTPPVVYSSPELKYRLFSHFGGVFWCDPDFYPIGRPGQEEQNALEQFPAIRADSDEFSAILKHLGLAKQSDYNNEEKLLIYREHKMLNHAVELAPSESVYRFTLRVGEGQGERIEGTITPSGDIKVLKREASFNTCPICLARGTLIDTPSGPMPVEKLLKGMAVWTNDGAGKRLIGQVVATATTPVPVPCQLVRVRLNDGRSVAASPGHPTAEGRALGNYQVGDVLDGALVMAVEPLAYDGGATYDLLPSGGAGLYWANGVLLKSTLGTD